MIPAIYMIAIGLFLMALELIALNFVLIFFGISFVIVGAINFGFEFSLEWQLVAASLLALVLIFALRGKLKGAFLKDSDGLNENFLDEAGVGEINNGMIYYKGTFWKSDEISGLKNGDKVEILGTKNGKIYIKK
ncbi:NfeD family protein [Campylobacter corcagiensis]|uniref:NfeD family protein n=1 Tax=Campylobacter corcagiensis TaxID=1448857 RepID=A0A7M1LG95_9BACT|nr:NfeD family protein [Campylobacter corcagiensis]QKF64934.1 YbbJ family protein [Campylobacter corcagiensis]QOQ86906.1 NfeD family protein [Campylobacter corcagiensis]